MKVIILAAGYATRLYPRTKNFPKPLLEVNGKPIVEYLVEKVARLKGVSKIIVVTNDRFAHVFKQWARALDARPAIEVLNDGTRTPEERLGAVGDMALAFKRESYRGDFLVLGGDNFFLDPLDGFIGCARRRKTAATVGVFDIKDRKKATHFGVVSLDGRGKVVDFAEKPVNPRSSLIAMCLYYFPQTAAARIKGYLSDKRNSSDAAGAFIAWLSRVSAVYGRRFEHLWVDIGNKETYDRVNSIIQRKE